MNRLDFINAKRIVIKLGTNVLRNDEGKEIPETDFKEEAPDKPDTEDGKTTHTVVKGETIHKMVTDALKTQGIDAPTDEQIKAAKKAFLAENNDLVQTYTGSVSCPIV